MNNSMMPSSSSNSIVTSMKRKHGSSELANNHTTRYSTNTLPFTLREKNLLIGGDNYGRDLPSVKNLQKKQQHFESELEGHDVKVQELLSSGAELEVLVERAASEIKERCGRLKTLWENLNEESDRRFVKGTSTLHKNHCLHQYSLVPEWNIK